MKITIGRRGIVLLAIAAALVVGAGIAYAAIPGSGNVYTACMLKNVGTIRLIDPSLPSKNLMSHCTNFETQISWNQVGQQGPSGATGATGATGPTGPAGSGALWATVRSDGSILKGSTGVTASESKTGVYEITFPQDVSSCGLTISSSQYAGIGITGVNHTIVDPPDLSHDFFTVLVDLPTPNTMVVGERAADTRAFESGPFTITAIC
jgi:hypothetical protein